MPSEVEKAYTAGIIDGEGYIGIYYDRRKWHIRERIDVHMKYPKIPRWLKKHWGGFVMKVQDGYIWRANSFDSRFICKEILPYMIEKKRQARIILELERVKSKQKPGINDTPKLKEKKHNLYIKLKEMHH